MALSRNSTLALLALLLPACAAPSAVRPSEAPVVQRQGVGPRLQLRAELGQYIPGAKIGESDGGTRLDLPLDLGQRIRETANQVWPTPATGEAPWLARVIVDKVEAGWPLGFGIDVTARAALRLVLVPGHDPTAAPVYERAYYGEATEGFMGAGAVNDGWKPVVEQAFMQALNKLLSDEEALAALGKEPPGAKAPAPVGGPAPIVAIFDLSDPARQLDEGSRAQLIGYLSTALVQTGRYKVIPRDQLRARLLDEKKESYRECFDEACQLELGKALAAEKSLTVQLLKVGKTCAVTANMYDLKTETADKGGLVNTGCSTDELLGAMAELAKQLAAN